MPLETDIEELRREVGLPGRYRLEAVDERHRQIKDVSAAIVMVPAGGHSGDEGAEAGPSSPPESGELNAYAVVMEAMRQNQEMARTNAEIARMVVDRFPAMLESAATLVTAAAGAGLPAREPRKEVRNPDDEDNDDEDDDDNDVEAEVEAEADKPAPKRAPLFDLTALIAQLAPLVPVLLAALGKGDPKLSSLAEILGAAMKPPTGPAAAPPTADTASAARAATPPPAAPDTAAGAATTPKGAPRSKPSATGSARAGAASRPAAPVTKPRAAEPATTAEAPPPPEPPTAAESATATEAPRNKASAATPQQTPGAPDVAPNAPSTADRNEGPPMLSPQLMAQFFAIQAALTPEECALVRAAAGELSPRDLRAWVAELAELTVPEAVDRVRAVLAATSKREAA
jgi:hypothetical protein